MKIVLFSNIISDITRKVERGSGNGKRAQVVENRNQRKTIVNSWVRCLENNQLVITSGFPTVNFRK